MTDHTSPIKVISRNSPLALLQVKEAAALFPTLDFTVQETISYGDRHKDVSLMADIASDFFTRELDEAVLSGKADIAVHSAKDIPYPLPAGLELFCLTKGGDKSDSLVSHDNLTLSQLPSGSRIGTSSKMRKAELLQLRNDIEVVSIRGTIEERIAQVDDGRIDALIVATCALQRLGLAERIAERLPFKTHPLQGNLAIVGREGDRELKSRFEKHDIRRSFGRVTLVGFGPGRADLLTLAGREALANADIIFHDDLLDQKSLTAYGARKIYVGKRNGQHSHPQEAINELLYQAALEGRKVVRLKGGDPMIFAHGREEIDYLRSRFVDVEVIPGVSSAIALAATTGIPLTHRGIASSVAFVSGHGSNIQTPQADTLVYYMGGTNLPQIAAALLRNGREADTPVALVHNVSLPDQKIFFTTVGEMRHSLLKYPTPVLAIIGKVVAFEYGRKTVHTLATGTSAPVAEPHERLTHMPLIRIEKSETAKEKRDELKRAPYDWIVFTSRHGVRFFFELLDEIRLDIRRLAHVRIASVGPVTTAALNAHHIWPDMESPTQSAEGILETFRREIRPKQRILLPRSDKGLPALYEGLQKMGHRVTDLTVYRNLPDESGQRIDISRFEKILFASPSGVDAFLKNYFELPSATLLVGKGDTTTNKLNKVLNETV